MVANYYRCLCGNEFCYICGKTWVGAHECPYYGPVLQAEILNLGGFAEPMPIPQIIPAPPVREVAQVIYDEDDDLDYDTDSDLDDYFGEEDEYEDSEDELDDATWRTLQRLDFEDRIAYMNIPDDERHVFINKARRWIYVTQGVEMEGLDLLDDTELTTPFEFGVRRRERQEHQLSDDEYDYDSAEDSWNTESEYDDAEDEDNEDDWETASEYDEEDDENDDDDGKALIIDSDLEKFNSTFKTFVQKARNYLHQLQHGRNDEDKAGTSEERYSRETVRQQQIARSMRKLFRVFVENYGLKGNLSHDEF